MRARKRNPCPDRLSSRNRVRTSGKCSASVPAQVKYVVIVDSMSLRQFGKFQSKRPRHFSTNGGEKTSRSRQLHTRSHTNRRKHSQQLLLQSDPSEDLTSVAL